MPDNPEFSPEVRARVARVLEESKGQKIKLTGLFRSIHPLVEEVAAAARP